jgi:hypothetical protein
MQRRKDTEPPDGSTKNGGAVYDTGKPASLLALNFFPPVCRNLDLLTQLNQAPAHIERFIL